MLLVDHISISKLFLKRNNSEKALYQISAITNESQSYFVVLDIKFVFKPWCPTHFFTDPPFFTDETSDPIIFTNLKFLFRKDGFQHSDILHIGLWLGIGLSIFVFIYCYFLFCFVFYFCFSSFKSVTKSESEHTWHFHFPWLFLQCMFCGQTLGFLVCFKLTIKPLTHGSFMEINLNWI